MSNVISLLINTTTIDYCLLITVMWLQSYLFTKILNTDDTVVVVRFILSGPDRGGGPTGGDNHQG